MSIAWLEPDWPAPPGVHAASTLRWGGFSQGPYAGLNLGAQVGDEPQKVMQNRALLRKKLSLPCEPLWLRQVHGSKIVQADRARPGVVADAGYTGKAGAVCAVLTADCLPILLADRQGVAAVHAGWRGLAAGVIEAALSAMGSASVMAWLGPAIGVQVFEVGAEVYRAFLQKSGAFEEAFHRQDNGKWRADLYELARLILISQGVRAIYGGGFCTYGDPIRFYSYRRDGVTGRMATLIWRE